jgi:predicted transglutaminase-like cysteine proteinase
VDLLLGTGTVSDPPVNNNPVITQQPLSASVTAGQSATFSVSASSTAALTYQWQSLAPGASGFTNIGGATSSSYTTPGTLLSDNGTQFQCVVSNSSGSVTTNTVTLTVQSSGTGGSTGAFVTSKVLGTLRNDYTGWVGMSITVGATPLNVTALGRILVAGNSGTHVLKIVNAVTGVDVPGGSAVITMTGSAGQFVYANLPSPIALNANTTYYVLSQEAAGGDRWYDFNTTATVAPVAGLTGAVWGGGAPYVFVAGSAGHMYIPVDLLYGTGTVSNPPTSDPLNITQQPQSASVTSGQTATFSVAASSTTAITYQWQSQASGASAFTNIGGATSSSYTTPSTLLSDNGTQFRCVLTNGSGSVTTNAATLSVQISSASGGTGASTPFLTSAVLGTLRNDYSGWVGMRITVSGSPLTITALGRIFAAGNSGTHVVKIVNAATGADVPGGSASITMTGSAGQFIYANLTAPVTLNANTAYYVLSQETSGGDRWYDFNTTADSTPVASLNGAVWGGGAPYAFVGGTAGRMYVPVDFKYSAIAPSGDSSYVTSAHVGTKRNDFSGWAGMAITVGSSPITVNSLGRMVTTGNNANHVVKLVNAAGVDILGGSVTISTASATPGNFAYASLASPVVLSANTTYYLVSQETAGGDAWYDFDTTLQTNSAATVTGAVWAYTNSYSTLGGAGHSYIPVDFKFQ